MKNYQLLIFCLITANCFAQKLTIVSQSKTDIMPEVKDFYYLSNEIDTSKAITLMTYCSTGKGKEGKLDLLFNQIYKQAMRDGANAFRLIKYQRIDSLDENNLTLKTFFIDSLTVKLNYSLYEFNTVYVFGEQRATKNFSHFITVNKKEIKIPSNRYYKFEKSDISKLEKIKLNYGGNIGGTIILTFKENTKREPVFLALFDGGVKPTGLFDGQMPGISINNGGFKEMSMRFGFLMKEIFKEM